MRVGGSRLEDRLGSHEPAYRSRGEAQVGRVLDRYGIPFYHEKPTRMVTDRGIRMWRPDFTLPSYDNLILEYAGMPDRPDYMQDVRYKQRMYDRNGYRSLFVYPNDLSGRDWPTRLIRKVDRAGGYQPMPSSRPRGYGSSGGRTYR